MSRILGVDPGSRKTGFGIIELDGKQIKHVINGRLLVGDGEFADRLKQIFDGLTDLILRYEPEIMSIEQVFLHKNADSALKLGQARGAAICAAVNQHLKVHEYSATQIKKAVVGNGHAKKEQVQYMMSVMLQLKEAPMEDAADALACAVTHANHAALDSLSNKLPAGMRISRRRGGRYSR
ncbi:MULTISPECIES: crossover junction endodeoxyribonuclease RuvC [unclassified Methylophaga]|jgi:crossover junction endodeoxyribonuclease RuvC|uniref:crossover junction endodeoxyribonuclease RuvC n=1 Tax=unclassified Methylophaga TaxID=2629249 RepID=UPI000C64F831|nr:MULTISPECIES: crossover junction endodeoxyribonuclease RuvC [unclassified Methylophaga]MAP27709.1 crossover junction endodeoxyribonuclease RuvC [Methylophaga sp.]MBP25442.1 crossover junction endodeoxyribonuclease RuvC [Methylophaga sp.]HAD30139.1 crossover junction endodeoxyribonuclease RuvC [Methylophaga sp.]HCO01314.1 crossover junction endodeoxyribonuclease RuvC [Methylophaga sp.]|tara:strand:+ start:149 stop:688 length:540 start_codon:yes stop_codon:yes gene_type:complete